MLYLYPLLCEKERKGEQMFKLSFKKNKDTIEFDFLCDFEKFISTLVKAFLNFLK